MNEQEIRAKSLELALQFANHDEKVSISRDDAGHFLLSPKLWKLTTEIYAFLTDGKSITGQYGIYPATETDT